MGDDKSMAQQYSDCADALLSDFDDTLKSTLALTKLHRQPVKTKSTLEPSSLIDNTG